VKHFVGQNVTVAENGFTKIPKIASSCPTNFTERFIFGRAHAFSFAQDPHYIMIFFCYRLTLWSSHNSIREIEKSLQASKTPACSLWKPERRAFVRTVDLAEHTIFVFLQSCCKSCTNVSFARCLQTCF